MYVLSVSGMGVEVWVRVYKETLIKRTEKCSGNFLQKHL